MRALQKLIVLVMLLVVVAEVAGCAGEPRGRKRSSGTTESK
jgi:hypothetical protein